MDPIEGRHCDWQAMVVETKGKRITMQSSKRSSMQEALWALFSMTVQTLAKVVTDRAKGYGSQMNGPLQIQYFGGNKDFFLESSGRIF